MPRKHSALWLVVHTLIPSLSGILTSICVVILLVIAHVIVLSVNNGVLAPGVFGQQSEQWVTVYGNYVLPRLDKLLRNNFLGTAATAFVWAVIGCLVLAILEGTFNTVREARETEGSVTFISPEQMVRHPLRRTLFLRWLWRLFIGMNIVLLTIALFPTMARLLGQDVAMLHAMNIGQLVRGVGTVIVGWTIIIHLYVVLVRLFMLRTRVFGEILY